ncbi:MAG: hypothetical protein K9K84_10185 [Methylovulum sp.]|jgi:hypothetical protein|nr:hypothetical protein [Methylovulum sp.]
MKNVRLLLLGLVSLSFFYLYTAMPAYAKKIITEKPQPFTLDEQELKPPLDLSLPELTHSQTERNPILNSPTYRIVDSLFAPKTKKNDRPLWVKGGLLMSPEPEVEKKKTVDGAGIVIQLKP